MWYDFAFCAEAWAAQKNAGLLYSGIAAFSSAILQVLPYQKPQKSVRLRCLSLGKAGEYSTIGTTNLPEICRLSGLRCLDGLAQLSGASSERFSWRSVRTAALAG